MRSIGIGFWASTPVCGPCRAAIVSSPRDRSCLGLHLFQDLRALFDVHSDGLDPVRITSPKGRDAPALTDHHVSTLHPLMGLVRSGGHPFSVFEGLTPCPSVHFSSDARNGLPV